MKKSTNIKTEKSTGLGCRKKLLINNFRNIGFEKPSELLLTSSFDYKKQGGLIILIGENNSGKSNVLDALYSFNDQYMFCKFDVHNKFKFDTSKIKLESSITHYGVTKNIIRPIITNDYEIKMSQKEYSGAEIYSWLSNDLYIFTTRNGYYRSNYSAELKKFVDSIDNELREYKQNEWINNENKKNSLAQKIYKTVSKYIYLLDEPSERLEEEIETFNKRNSNILQLVKSEKIDWNNDEVYSLKVIRYQENKETDNLKIKLDEIENNDFFIALFQSLNYNYNEIFLLFEQADELDTTGNISCEKEELNRKLIPIADDFNKLYSFDSQKYSFQLDFNRDEITFNIFKNNTPVALKQQSIGFKCFFQLYFKIIKNKNFAPGSIIVIDEPGIHLHPKGQEELGNFFRRFGKENNIIFVISTHSPFIIDLDRLDEIRIVEVEDKVQNAIINNNFTLDTQTSKQTDDPLFQIKKNLTVGENVLLKPKTKIIFVEGITDYNYLTAFKNYFNKEKYKNIYFIPFSGVGKWRDIPEKFKKISNLLEDYNTYALVDGDDNGKKLQECSLKSNSKLTVWTLSDINKNFIKIESLFANEDKEKPNVKCVLDGKTEGWSWAFKNNFDIKNNLSKKTIENFEELFDKLVERTTNIYH